MEDQPTRDMQWIVASGAAEGGEFLLGRIGHKQR
jgi:hypothetical protein